MKHEIIYEQEGIIIRKYQFSDCKALAELFYHTVHTINARDYTSQQLHAWADGHIDLDKWNQSLLEHYTLVAEVVLDEQAYTFTHKRKMFADKAAYDSTYESTISANAVYEDIGKVSTVQKITHAIANDKLQGYILGNSQSINTSDNQSKKQTITTNYAPSNNDQTITTNLSSITTNHGSFNNKRVIVGFGDIVALDNAAPTERRWYLDHLYVHADYQRQGIASLLCDLLESAGLENTILESTSSDDTMCVSSILKETFYVASSNAVNTALSVLTSGATEHTKLSALTSGASKSITLATTSDVYESNLLASSKVLASGSSNVLCGVIVTHASITARPFFEKRGYRVKKEQTVIRHGVALQNFVMEKLVQYRQ